MAKWFPGAPIRSVAAGFWGLLAAHLCGFDGLAVTGRARADATEEAIEVDATMRTKMALCTDGKSHYVIVGPYAEVADAVYYGDGKRFTLGPVARDGMRRSTNFFDPRFFNDKLVKYRNWDPRVYSQVTLDPLQQTCSVRCGTRNVPLTLVAAAQARELVAQATFLPSPQKYEPYKLARDDQGTYYYIERGASEKRAKDFRIFIGLRGHMKRVDLANIASDSKGDVFAAANGRTKLLMPTPSAGFQRFIDGDQSTTLNDIPILGSNWQVIYNDLGVYAGQRLGTPCDDL